MHIHFLYDKFAKEVTRYHTSIFTTAVVGYLAEYA
jgi:hypothetical protein